MSIRTAEASDLDAIMALERASFPSDAWSAEMMRAELVSPHGRYIVDEEAGRVVGYAGLRAVSGAADADIQTITVDGTARRRGRGRHRRSPAAPRHHHPDVDGPASPGR